MIKKPTYFGGYGGGGDTSKFRELADAWAKRPEGDPRRALIERAEREGKERAADFKETVDLVTRAVRPIDAQKLAAAIVSAGARRRADVPDKPTFADDASGQLAKKIYNAARKRDGKPEVE
jgi:hypothetical protein